MKKLTKVSLFAVAALTAGIMTTSAKTMTEDQLNSLASIKVGSQEISENLYIYGKYVYINTITSAELNDAMNDLLNDVEYAKSYRELFKDKVAALIHKDSNNNWENLTYGGSLAKTVSIEMTHIIGDLKGEHLSNIASLYSDGSYVKTETLPSKKTAEIFVDEKAELSIAGVRAVSKIARLNNSDISTDTHRYNTSAVSIAYDKKLDITKNKPLLTYNNGKGSEEWIGLIIKTNKAVTSTDTIKLNGNPLTLEDATEHGGDAREYVAWVKFADIKNNLTLEINHETVQTIEVNVVDDIKDVITITDVESENDPVVANLSENLKTASALINGKYTVFLYGEKSYNNNTTVDFTINGDMKRATKSSSRWSVSDLIDVLSVKGTPLASTDRGNAEWNKQAITGADFVKEKGKLGNDEYEYVVNVHTNKVPYLSTGVLVDIDLSAAVSTGSTISKSAATDDSETTYTVKLTQKESVVTFTNSSLSTQTVKVKFVIIDETPDVNISIVPGNAGDNVNVYSNPNPTQAGTNVNYRYNMNRASFTTKQDENGNYTITIQEKSLDSRLVQFTDTDKFNGGSAYWFGFIVTLDKDPLTSANNYTVKKASADLTVNDVLVTDAKNIGATSDNAFALWVSGSGSAMSSTYTITDKTTQKSVTVTFEVKVLDSNRIKDVDTDASKVTSVVPTEEYANEVKYDASRKDFTINTDTDSFVAKTTIEDTIAGVKTTTTKEYTYVVLVNGTTENRCGFGTSKHSTEKCVRKVQNLELTDVYFAQYDRLEPNQYNLDSIEDVSFDGNVVNVVLNRNIKGSYALLLDLGIGEYKYASNENVVLRGASVLEPTNANRFVKDAPTNLKNLALVWVPYTEGKDVELVLTHKTTNGSVELVSKEYKIVVKTTVDNKAKELELKKAEKVNFDPNFTDTDENKSYFTKGDDHQTVKDNNKYLTSISFDGSTITAGYDHTLTSNKFAILMDLGVDPTYLTVKDGSVRAVTIDTTTAAKSGYTGTEFLLIVDNSKITSGSIELTFDQSHTSNKDNRYGKELKLTLVVKDEIETMSVSSNNISERSASIKSTEDGFDYDNVAYAANQNNFEYEFKYVTDITGTLTIKPSTENVQPSYYVLNKIGNPNAWYAIAFDLGVEIDVPTTRNSHGRVEEVDYKTGKFVLWYNHVDVSDQLIIKNHYNGTSYTLTVENK